MRPATVAQRPFHTSTPSHSTIEGKSLFPACIAIESLRECCIASHSNRWVYAARSTDYGTLNSVQWHSGAMIRPEMRCQYCCGTNCSCSAIDAMTATILWNRNRTTWIWVEGDDLIRECTTYWHRLASPPVDHRPCATISTTTPSPPMSAAKFALFAGSDSVERPVGRSAETKKFTVKCQKQRKGQKPIRSPVTHLHSVRIHATKYRSPIL